MALCAKAAAGAKTSAVIVRPNIVDRRMRLTCHLHVSPRCRKRDEAYTWVALPPREITRRDGLPNSRFGNLNSRPVAFKIIGYRMAGAASGDRTIVSPSRAGED